MEHLSNEKGFTCKAVMWGHDGPQLAPHDEQHATRFEVSDKRGNVVGFISPDRARQHPQVQWERSLFHDGKIRKLVGKYATVQEALAAF